MRCGGVPGSAIHSFWLIACELAPEKAFSKCLACCDVLVRVIELSQHSHLQRPGQNCGVATLTHHSSLSPGLEAFDPFMHTCLSSLGLLFWEVPLDSHDFPSLRVDPSLQASRHSQGLLLPYCSMMLYCLTELFFMVISIPAQDEIKISTFLPLIYILCNQSNQEL